MTQLVVAVDLNRCNPSVVAGEVEQQVGFSVVLLDSKCFPIMENSATSALDFWKSNRKILAASKDLYNKLTGCSADPKHARHEIDVIRIQDDDVAVLPMKRRKGCLDSSSVSSIDSNKLNRILEEIELLRKGNEMVKVASSMFECIICKDVMQSPQYATCCERIIGCETCIDHWLDQKLSCPHCSATAVLMSSSFKTIRGLDDFLKSLRFLNTPFASDDLGGNSSEKAINSDDDDFVPPRFNLH